MLDREGVTREAGDLCDEELGCSTPLRCIEAHRGAVREGESAAGTRGMPGGDGEDPGVREHGWRRLQVDAPCRDVDGETLVSPGGLQAVPAGARNL